MFQVSRRGLTPTNRTRIMCLSLFWHFLDVVWIWRVLCCLSDGGNVMSHSTDHNGASHGSVKSYMTGLSCRSF
ncbi:Cytochrome o ubiquinol oxidase subunit 3 [Raoultella terrigena]|uniref:Cytochrome o ubiquinol oxidase subunit 3 n=1 Tax=Raoultella terrigena TaxID=577 RepID=A0A4U9D7I7_RAOTE|nr:Cytochrome o ubiquinol oxidase subunit 3 [Raoultella terrigena]